MNAQDIANLVNFIDTVVARGAIRGDELAVVADLRSKLVKVVEDAQQAAGAEQGTITREVAETTEEESGE